MSASRHSSAAEKTSAGDTHPIGAVSPSRQSAIISHGELVKDPTEVYGRGPVLIRIGNGGAGATGLIGALANDYLSTLPEERSIVWICNHSRNSQLALLHGYVDIALTYERDQEELAKAEGWSVTKGCAFHDHFCIAGPLEDPANVRNAISLSDGLQRVAKSRSLFHSRADTSATMWKERGLWSTCNLLPWEYGGGISDRQWYQTSLLSPSEALKKADAAGAYLLTDRSTLLRQVSTGTISNTTVFFEPTSENDFLMNSCYAVCSPTASRETLDFLEYLLTDRAQDLIKSYGKDQCGLPLFAMAADGFARTSLKGGRPVKGHWVFEDVRTD
ncbi:hypothetical protein J7T55_012788 [Diaporthe amygdali]|uniref:uncharacterized protein n=1 Tax=Phomopsis amygdali TaxID=1214568 RepID=UPI0022FEEE2A|nr:uncharacterized protein J7T55_012788 [Diaporthe amygdali]KAJ0115508.1 hypothetical protein J7T55_012788 [Diaporthe amygdali]